MTYRVRFSAVA